MAVVGGGVGRRPITEAWGVAPGRRVVAAGVGRDAGMWRDEARGGAGDGKVGGVRGKGAPG